LAIGAYGLAVSRIDRLTEIVQVDLPGKMRPYVVVGALIVTVTVAVMAEVARSLRFINVAFGLWLIASFWLLAGGGTLATAHRVIVGLALIALSLPRGTRSQEHYGGWDRDTYSDG
jgi:hypothetical protein